MIVSVLLNKTELGLQAYSSICYSWDVKIFLHPDIIMKVIFMYKTILALGTNDGFDISIKEQISLFKECGFDGFFVNWVDGMNIKEIREHAEREGMIFQSIHAPSKKSPDLWTGGEGAKEAVEELLRCVRDCGENGVPIMVCHAIIGYDMVSPNEYGVKNWKIVIDEAKRLGVNVAIENLEGELYLKALLEAFSEYENVGFCWDTGHEMCYNHKDMMALYGEKIMCTHLNDNLGARDFNGKMQFADDLHLLPFDGIADWGDIVKRLNKYGYDGILTFELKRKSKKGAHENDVYEKMTPLEYVCEAHKRACAVAAMKLRDKNIHV